MSEFPVVLNHRVKRALKYPQTHRSAVIAQAFWRARRYAGMMRAISQQKTRDFWQLRLPTETKRFVPKFMAMTIISRDPGRYGFSPPSEAPHDIEFLHVSQPTEIRHIADAAGTTVTHLRELNPELVGLATPSDEPRYALRIPRRFIWVSHKVQKGETLVVIARRYKVGLQMLREANKLDRSDDLTVGRVLLVPTEATPPPA